MKLQIELIDEQVDKWAEMEDSSIHGLKERINSLIVKELQKHNPTAMRASVSVNILSENRYKTIRLSENRFKIIKI